MARYVDAAPQLELATRNVRVLAIGQVLEVKEGRKGAEGQTATLELTPAKDAGFLGSAAEGVHSIGEESAAAALDIADTAIYGPEVGVLGLTNPGIAIWDKANVEGKIK